MTSPAHLHMNLKNNCRFCVFCLWDRACKSQANSISLYSFRWPGPPGMTGVHPTPDYIMFCTEYLRGVHLCLLPRGILVRFFYVLPSTVSLLIWLTCTSPCFGERIRCSGQPISDCRWRWQFPRSGNQQNHWCSQLVALDFQGLPTDMAL